jgi:hypothetical protein
MAHFRQCGAQRRSGATVATMGLLTTAGLLAAIPLLSGDRRAEAATQPPSLSLTPARPDQTLSFRDRLIAGLQARLPSEIEFIDRVLAEVEARRLPPTLVNQTFFWARQRSAISRDARSYRPIIYFRIAMTLQAKRLGVAL